MGWKDQIEDTDRDLALISSSDLSDLSLISLIRDPPGDPDLTSRSDLSDLPLRPQRQ